MTDPVVDTADELRGRLKWFLLGRFAVISCFLAIGAASYLQSARERYDVPVQQLMLAVAVTYAFSAVSALLLPHARRLRLFTYVQIAFDVVLISGVIYLTGGVESPFPFFYSLPIINAAVLLFADGALYAAVAAAFAYDGLMLALAAAGGAHAEGFDLHVGLRIGSANLTFGLIAFLASILTRRLDAAEKLLREKEAERDHLARLQDTLARTINSGLLTIDADDRITSADAVAAELAGRPADRLWARRSAPSSRPCARPRPRAWPSCNRRRRPVRSSSGTAATTSDRSTCAASPRPWPAPSASRSARSTCSRT